MGALDAEDWLTIKLQFGRYHLVVEADIKGFFDNLNPEWMIQMLEERMEDGALRRLIQKWHKGDGTGDGEQVWQAVGVAPQGGIV